LILGLDNAGKTSILKAIAKEDIKTINPTKGFNVKIVNVDNISFSVWDLGGQISIRGVWENYYRDNDAIVNFIKFDLIFL
jgi:small GTP-binding protein